MANDIERVLQAVPIESYIGRFVKLKRKGNNSWGLCPFHNEKSPSFSVAPDKGIFKCFGCGVGGNVISFVQQYEKVGFGDALKLLAEYSGIVLEKNNSPKYQESKNKKEDLFQLNLWVANLYFEEGQNSPVSQAYLKYRKLDLEAIRAFQIGYAPDTLRYLETQVNKRFQNDAAAITHALESLTQLGLLGKNNNETYNRFRDRLIFPILDNRGRHIAFGGRIITEKANTGKYINSPESEIFSKKNTLFNLFRAKEYIRSDGQAILVEGYLDVVGLYQKKIYNVVAPLGTSFTEEQAKLLKRYTDKLVLFLDDDEAGQNAAMKALKIARAHSLETKIVVKQDSSLAELKAKDPFDICQMTDDFEVLTLLSAAKTELQFVLWFYFLYKHNIGSLEEKRRAIADFFEYIADLPTQWEKQEFLKHAQKILQIDEKSLAKDFEEYSSGNQQNFQQSFGKNNSISKGLNGSNVAIYKAITLDETEILGLLIRFPEFWYDEITKLELQWSTTNAQLIFEFFRDRIFSGEAIDWDAVKNIGNQLPPDLFSDLSGIILSLDDVFTGDLEYLKQREVKAEDYYEYKLKTLMINHRIADLDAKIRNLTSELAQSEQLSEQKADNLSMEIDLAFKEKKHWKDFLASKLKGY